MEDRLRVVSLFSGIGAYEKALENLKVPHVVLNFCEIDPHAARCYVHLHEVDKDKNLKDVSRIVPDDLPAHDLLVFSPPCQDISIAGRHAGASGKRTGLMWRVVEMIARKQPKYFLMENVKTLAGKYKPDFDAYVADLEGHGYTCTHAVLNAVDHGTPQSRERLYMVGVKNWLGLRFEMPPSRPLNKQVKDFLDVAVDDIDRKVSKTIRVGGRKSRIENRHNWDGFWIDGKPHYLTAKECLKLMGFSGDDYDILKGIHMSEGRIARLAGNSVVVSVLEDLLKALLTPAALSSTSASGPTAPSPTSEGTPPCPPIRYANVSGDDVRNVGTEDAGICS